MQEQTNKVNIEVRKLEPSEGMHLLCIKTKDIYEGAIYLGAYDRAENYIEVTEEEYQEYLKAQEEKANEAL